MYNILVYNPRDAITQDLVYGSYEIYGSCTLHVDIDLVMWAHKSNIV